VIGGDLIAFYALALLSIASAVMVVEARDIFRAALFLALLFASVGGIYILLTAEFIAAVQVLIYGGAVVVIILFAIVLTRRELEMSHSSTGGLAVRALLTIGLIAALIQPLLDTPWPLRLAELPEPNTYSVGYSLFTDYVIPFEIVSVALLAALIGALYISRREVA